MRKCSSQIFIHCYIRYFYWLNPILANLDKYKKSTWNKDVLFYPVSAPTEQIFTYYIDGYF
jgi:hypothetical protein